VPPTKPIFRFETFWPKMHGFHDCVQQAWNRSVPANQNPQGPLHIKLTRTAKTLKQWVRGIIQQKILAIATCREVIRQLEKVQEFRVWLAAEHNLIKLLKSRILGLAAVDRSRARQKSRLTWMRLGDANTFFPYDVQC
jgi:hypothetical protein